MVLRKEFQPKRRQALDPAIDVEIAQLSRDAGNQSRRTPTDACACTCQTFAARLTRRGGRSLVEPV